MCIRDRIKATNAVIRDLKKKIALLFDWIAEAKAELTPEELEEIRKREERKDRLCLLYTSGLPAPTLSALRWQGVSAVS